MSEMLITLSFLYANTKRNSDSLKFLDPSGSVQACSVIASSYTITC